MSTLPSPIRELYSSLLPELSWAVKLLPKVPLKHRSVIIKCCQAQYCPETTDPPEHTLVGLLKDLPPFIYGTFMVDVFYVLDHIRYAVQSQVLAPIILDLCRGSPLPIEEIEEARLKSWSKEIEVCETLPPVGCINWDVIFDDQHFNDEIIPGVPANRTIALYINSCLKQWRKEMCSRLHYPRMTFKNMSRATVRDWELRSGMIWDSTSNPIFGQVTWQRFYMETGHKLAGECEIRQKWYPSQAKPRTYFASGGLAYTYSADSQDMWTELVNSYTPCHHISRLIPERVRLKTGQHARIYDLETFTSRMHEQRRFLNGLSAFCNGWEFVSFDVREGVIQRDLGEYLWDYTANCTSGCHLSYERVPGIDEGFHSEQSHSGMLGVFGNLMSCTFAHAAVMSFCVEDESQLNVAGNDGEIAEDIGNAVEINICICALGRYERSKTFTSLEPGCICLKRPLAQSGTILHTKLAIIPPSIITLAHSMFGYTDARYSYLEDDKPSLNVVAKELMRFLRSIFRAFHTLNPDDVTVALYLARGITKLCQADLGGSVPQCGDPYFWPAIPRDYDSFTVDPLIATLQCRYTGTARVSRREVIDKLDFEDYNVVGAEFRGNLTRHLGLLVKLGFLEYEVEMETLSHLDGYYRLVKEYTSPPSDIVYHFIVTREIPSYFIL